MLSRLYNGLPPVKHDLSSQERTLCTSIQSPLKPISIKSDKGSKIELAEFSGPGLLVLSDTYYPGWKAYDQITGRELPIHPANIAFRGVFLEEERTYRIAFHYKPSWLKTALMSLSSGLIMLLLWSARHYFQKQKSKTL
jgi:hypothetical protein